MREGSFSRLKSVEVYIEDDGVCFDILRLSPQGVAPFENVVLTVDYETATLHISRLDLTVENGKLEFVSDIARLSRNDPDFFHVVKWKLRVRIHNQ